MTTKSAFKAMKKAIGFSENAATKLTDTEVVDSMPKFSRITSARASKICKAILSPAQETDIHADKTLLGGGVLKLYDYNFPFSFQGYYPSLGAKQYSTISGALAYVNPFTGLKYHLIFHQAIYMPDLNHHLLCPMQFCANGVVINECTQMYCRDPTQESHAIVAMDENGVSVVVPFFLR